MGFQGTHRLERIHGEGPQIAQDHILLEDHCLPVEKGHLEPVAAWVSLERGRRPGRRELWGAIL